nr:venom polypeptide precursor [Doratifera vulnerans]
MKNKVLLLLLIFYAVGVPNRDTILSGGNGNPLSVLKG